MKRFAPPEAVVMLLLESVDYPMHIGAVQVFRPPAGAAPGFARQIYEEMRRHSDVDKKWSGHPARTRRGHSVLRWNYEDEVDIDYHVRYTAVPAPGGDADLMKLVSDMHSQPLDRDRPLWQVHVIDGLSGGRFATYIKGHHALADGVSGVKMSQQVLSADPHDDRVRVAWAPQPGRRDAAPRATRTQLAGPLKFAVHLGKSVPMIRAALRERHLLPALRAPRTLFNVNGDASRRCEAQSFSAHRVKAVAAAARVTFNDVALAMTAGALRAYLVDLDALPGAPLVAMVPVNIRGEDDALGGNVIGSALCNLGTDIDDPAKRLDLIHASMQHNIDLIRRLPKQVALHLAGVIVAPVSGERGLRSKIPPMFNLAISYVRGQDEPLYRRGALLENFYGFLPTMRGNAVNVVLFTTSENLGFGLAASATAVPDLDVLTGHLETALKDLERAVGL